MSFEVYKDGKFIRPDEVTLVKPLEGNLDRFLRKLEVRGSSQVRWLGCAIVAVTSTSSCVGDGGVPSTADSSVQGS